MCIPFKQIGEGCIPAIEPCDDGLICQLLPSNPGDEAWVCIPSDSDGFVDDAVCRQHYNADVHQTAIDSGGSLNFGYGSAAAAAAGVVFEAGVVYGQECYGCYFSECVGLVTNVGVSAFGTVGAYRSLSDFGGRAAMVVETAGISVVAFSTAQAFNFESPPEFIGTASAISIGVSLIPIDVAVYECTTVVDTAYCLDPESGALVEVTNSPPQALCFGQTVCADGVSCVASVTVGDDSSDPDGDDVTITETPSGPFGIGTTTVTATVTDPAGLSDSCTADVVVEDCTPPAISCPLTTVAECESASQAFVDPGDAVTSDCTAVTVTNPGASSYPLGSTTVGYTAVDAAGNSSSCNTTVTVRDTLAPAITCPASVVLECPADTSVGATGMATATDACNAPAIASSDVSVPGCGHTETITRTWTATDASGNSSSCVQIIEVVDTTPPAITCVDPVTLDRGDRVCNEDVARWLESTTATDACSDGVSIGEDSADNGFGCGFPFDSATSVTWVATDACGLTSECSSTISILPAHRISTTKKGSLLMFSNVELKWDGAGNLIQDTVLEISNDFEDAVFVQFYFVNGDDPLDAVFAGNPPQMVVEDEPGWNNVDCQTLLTANQPMYMSMSSGSPLGCQPFGILDPGTRPGRPDVEGPAGQRVLRGYVYAWAVDSAGEEIRWNHLSGSGTIVNYGDASAWEYEAYTSQTTCLDHGDRPLDCIEFDNNGTCCDAIVKPGRLELDGFQYDIAFDQLLMSFVASGSDALSGSDFSVQVDTDLTLYPIGQDLRVNSEGPVTTSAKFDIWNMSENRFSGTTRCITCWDQTLLSDYDAPNHFLVLNLQSDKGKARIDGIAGTNDCGRRSQSAAILGVTNKLLSFSGVALNRAASGRTLVGQGTQSATIRNDIIKPPGELVGIAGEVDAQRVDLGLSSSVTTRKVARPREAGR